MKTFFLSFQSSARRFLCCALFALLGTNAGWSAAETSPAQPGVGEAFRPNERAFLEKALESSRQQMLLAEVGANQASSSEVRAHALQLAADYRELNNALEALVRHRGGLANAPVGATSENYRQLSARSGNDFDREFVRIAATSSDNVMALFEQALNTAKDSDVRELASAQLPILREHHNRGVELRKAFE